MLRTRQADPLSRFREGWRLKAQNAKDTWLPGTLPIETAMEGTFHDGIKSAAEFLKGRRRDRARRASFAVGNERIYSLGMTDRDMTWPDLWCRVEEEGGRVNRVDVMHPNGEILLSFPPNHFLPEVVKRMSAGQVRARLVPAGKSETALWLEDESGNRLYCEKVEPASTAEPRDGAER